LDGMDRKEEWRERNNETSIDRKRNRRIYRGSKRICGLLSRELRIRDTDRHRYGCPMTRYPEIIPNIGVSFAAIVAAVSATSLRRSNLSLSGQHPNGTRPRKASSDSERRACRYLHSRETRMGAGDFGRARFQESVATRKW